MKRKLYLMGMFAATAFLTACSQNEVVEESKVTHYEATQPVDYQGEDYITVAEGENMELLLQPSTGNVRWMNKETGEYLDTKKTDTELKDTTALSDVVAYYYSGPESTKYEAISSMDSYTYAIETGEENSLIYEEMENGVRLVYTLGSDEITYKNFPAYLTDERMQELVIQYLDEAQIKTLKTQYQQTKSGLWSRKTGENAALSGMAAPQLYSIFYEVGHYTYDDLVEDAATYEREDELPFTQTIEVVMEYTLDGDDLVFRIPTEHLVSDEEYPINYLEVLPYFMASESKDGYLFVPDGSGALIYLDNDKEKETPFSARYYGGDVLQDMETYKSADVQMMLPVYGIKADDYAVLGIIEEGAEVARLNAYTSTYKANIDYSRLTLSFLINDAQKLASYVGSTINYDLYKNSTDYYTGDIQVRYSFLTGDDADYAGMAKEYQDYLIEKGTLTALEESEADSPLFLNLLGEVDKEKYFLGIPYDSSIALTSFEQAGNIIQEITDADIDNLIVKYEGVMNGGMNQRGVESVKISSRLGGKSDWNELLELADTLGVKLYPSVALQTAYTRKSLSKSELAYTIGGAVAVDYTFDPVDNLAETDEKFLKYIISPTYMEKYVEKFAKSYSKLGIENLASGDLMTFISADYRNKANVSQTTASPMYDNALATLKENYNLLLSNPRVDVYSSVEYLTDIPLGNSEIKILDASVPFTQMVLEGCVTYASDYINKDSESLSDTVMKAMETKSALNFRLIDTETNMLEDTTLDNVFFSEYETWKDDIIESYNAYNEFYQKVKDAEIVDHVIYNRIDHLRVVTYDNGVTAYFNYGDKDVRIDGVSVKAHSYVIQEGGANE